MQDQPVIEFSANRTSIAKALLSAQAGLKPLVRRTSNNHYGSKYAELSDLLDSTMPSLHSADIVLVQGASTSPDGSVTVETQLLHVSSEWVRTFLTLTPSRSDPQGIGSAITYARRYSLQTILGIAAETMMTETLQVYRLPNKPAHRRKPRK